MMKKFLMLLLCGTMFCTTAVLTSCDKEEDETYYAGESEEDYKANTYTITADWELSNVAELSSLSADQLAALEKQLEDECVETAIFNSRAEAIAAFDLFMEELRKNEDGTFMVGMKVKLYLKRGDAVIKSAELEW